jgi:hypothetical protein
MMRFVVCLSLVAVVAAYVAAQAPGFPAPAQPGLVVSPAHESVPALKHDFRHDLLDTLPGNAAALYNKAVLLLAQNKRANDDAELIRTWLDAPLGDLPRADARRLLDTYAAVLGQVTLGGKREECKWDEPWRDDNPFTAILLPQLAHFRLMGRLVALKARLEIAEGKHEEACRTLRDGYVLALRVTDGRFLIEVLVGLAMTNMLNDQVEALIASPDAPNLYHALSGLPRPFVNLRNCMELELNGIFLLMPELRNPEVELATAEQWNKAFARFRTTMRQAGEAGIEDGLKLVAGMVRIYPTARKHLLAKGRPEIEVNKLPMHVVVALHLADRLKGMRDDMLKLSRLPFAQAWPGLQKTDARMGAVKDDLTYAIVLAMMPALSRSALSVASVDRRIAALRCVEALRMHAAQNGNALPAKLTDVKIVPIPNDPMTGKPFEYALQGGTAILKSPKLDGEWEKHAVHYRITVRK